MWRQKLYRGTWCAVTRVTVDGKSCTKRVSLRTTDRDEAGRQFSEFLANLEGPKETVLDILLAWQKDRHKLKSQKTIKFAIKFLTPHFGHLKPHQVTREVCRKFVKARNKKNSTVRRELEVLRAALRWHNKNTPAIVELPSASPPRERFLSRAEYDALLAAAYSPHLRLFIVLALQTAARASALMELQWGQVQWQRNQIELSKGEEQKNKRRALVPMTPKAREALEEAYKARTCESVIEFGGGPVLSISKGFKNTADRAGLKDVTPHVLRRTAAVWMAEAGVPMSEIAQFLGHTSTVVTERVYARYSPDYLQKAARALG